MSNISQVNAKDSFFVVSINVPNWSDIFGKAVTPIELLPEV